MLSGPWLFSTAGARPSNSSSSPRRSDVGPPPSKTAGGRRALSRRLSSMAPCNGINQAHFCLKKLGVAASFSCCCVLPVWGRRPAARAAHAHTHTHHTPTHAAPTTTRLLRFHVGVTEKAGKGGRQPEYNDQKWHSRHCRTFSTRPARTQHDLCDTGAALTDLFPRL